MAKLIGKGVIRMGKLRQSRYKEMKEMKEITMHKLKERSEHKEYEFSVTSRVLASIAVILSLISICIYVIDTKLIN